MYNKFSSCLGILSLKNNIFFTDINHPAYYINFIATNNQPNFRSLLGYIWYLYSYMSGGVFLNDFDYDYGLCLREKIDSTAWKYKWLKYMLSLLSGYVRRPNFSKHSERFERILVVKIWHST